MFISIGTLNIDRAGAAKFNATLAFLEEFPAEIVSLQQIDVSPWEFARYVHEWKGTKCCLHSLRLTLCCAV